MSKGNFGEVGAHPKIRTTGWRTAPEGRPPSWCWVAARFSERRLEQEMAKAMPVVASDALPPQAPVVRRSWRSFDYRGP